MGDHGKENEPMGLDAILVGDVLHIYPHQTHNDIGDMRASHMCACIAEVQISLAMPWKIQEIRFPPARFNINARES